MVMNGLRTVKGINLRELSHLPIKPNIDDALNKWSNLIIDKNHLKLLDNDFILLDEITSDLFI